MNRTRIAFTAGALFAGSIALSFVHPWGNVRSEAKADTPLLDGSAVPDNVRHVLEKKCADCHSTNTDWPLYSKLAPGSWLVEHDVHEGRNHLNMSQWQGYYLETKIDLLSKIASEARSGQMPVKQYLILHPKARLSSEEQQLIYDWAKAERKHIKQQIEGLQDKPAAN
jgi:cytochrome c